MKVYIIRNFSDYQSATINIKGVFSTIELAREYIKDNKLEHHHDLRHNNDGWYEEWYGIEEHELNETLFVTI